LLLLGGSCNCYRRRLELLQLEVLLEQLHLLLLCEPLCTCCNSGSSSNLLCLSCLLLSHHSCSLYVCCCLPQLLERGLVLQSLHCQVHAGGQQGLGILEVPVGGVDGSLGLGAHLNTYTPT
jgi:hypothetical protein